jgi:hypothetical protein
MSSPPVSGYSLRIIADLAWAAGQKELATRLHELAREQEAIERGQCAA